MVGVGVIGCFVGGLLVVGGCCVVLLVWLWVKIEIEWFGLCLIGFDGMDCRFGVG